MKGRRHAKIRINIKYSDAQFSENFQVGPP